VNQVKDRTRILPDSVYVIPPNKDLYIQSGVLRLAALGGLRGHRLPIDFFFRALAADQQDHAVGIILSGMGTDGTLGLRAIKEKEGLVLVQAPESAKFDSMPRSAIEAGLADFVGPVEDLPGKLLASLRRIPLVAAPGAILEAKTQSSLEKILTLLRASTGHDFSHYKKSTIYRRIERRMALHQLEKIVAYVRHLQEAPNELELLFKELLIGVTSFFRDPETWEQLKTQGLPAILTFPRTGQGLRAWVPACSTGEEAYSLAIVFREVLEQRKSADAQPLQIFATDLDRDAIDRARLGVFPDNIAADVSPERLKRFFIKEDRGYRIRRDIREMVTFAPQNLLADPPFTKLHILSCRNLLIYLEAEVQKKLIPLFHYCLNPGGLLFLGNAESAGQPSSLFTPLGGKARVFRRTESALLPERVELPSAFVRAAQEASEGHRTSIPLVSLQGLADQVLLQRYSPAAVLVNDQGDILYI
ncbi:MAG TPA: CheR family methyltransferase, partial [Candidatus Methylomirabilis sp.]|nr:CheR family methyltransferase [Candidatus Methylomirabilis sp.]